MPFFFYNHAQLLNERDETHLCVHTPVAVQNTVVIQNFGQQHRLIPDGNAWRNSITASNHLSSPRPFILRLPIIHPEVWRFS